MEALTPEGADRKPGEQGFNDAMVRAAMEGFRAEQNLLGAVIAGLTAGVAGAAVWAGITVLTGFQIGWMAVGVGFLVGFAVRGIGKGIDKTFGVAGALLALFGCLLGNALTIVYYVAQAQEMTYFDALMRINPAAIPELMALTFSPIDLLFYGVAVYEGYKFAIREISDAELKQAITGIPAPPTSA